MMPMRAAMSARVMEFDFRQSISFMAAGSHIGYSAVKPKHSQFSYDIYSRNGYFRNMANRIKQLMKERNLSRDDVADGIGAHPITVSKLISGKMKLTEEWMDKFATVFAVPREQIIAAPSATRLVKVRSYVEAGVWEQHAEWPEEDWYEVAIPDDPRYRMTELFGSETRGPSMNKRYPEHTVLVHTSLAISGESLEIGKRYVVERERSDGTRETTVKTLSRDLDGRLWLMPESTDPRFQTPIPIDDEIDSIVRVIGKVVYSVQRED